MTRADQTTCIPDPPGSSRRRMRLRSRAWEIALIYAVFGMLYIFFSDRALALLVSDPERLVTWSSYKGFAFIGLTAVLLLIILTRTFGIIGDAHASAVAAERSLRESEERFQAFMDESPAIAWVVDEQGRHTYVNRAWADALGVNRQAWLGRTAADVAPRPLAERLDRWSSEVMASGRPIRSVAEEIHTDGADAFWDVSVFPFRSSAGRPFVGGIAVDVTARVRAEQLLRESKETLEQKVAERTADLEAACVRAESADQVKTAFLATMSHELRTPLNSIIGFTSIVLQGLAGPLTDEQRKQLEMVRTSARHLLALVSDLLDISRVESGLVTIASAPFDLRRSVTRVVESIRTQARVKGLALHVAIEPGLDQMLGDERRFEQILLNLLSNAIKFTQRGEVEVSLDSVDGADLPDAEPGQRAVRLRVRDTGIGIRAEDMPLLFQPFRQLDSGLARAHEGSGLGLAICRRLAGLMGGYIRVESEFGRGSTFVVTLPAPVGINA